MPLSDSLRERQLQLLHSLRASDTHGQRRVINKEIGGDEGGERGGENVPVEELQVGLDY